MAISTVKLNGETLMTVDDTTADASEVLSGQYFYAADGTKTQGSIATKTASNLSVSGATVTAPAGYYASAASASVASGTAGTPSASKGAVSNHSILVTPTVTNTTGYITGGTISGTAVTVSASELASGTLSIASNASGINVVGYSAVDVDVPSVDFPVFTVTIDVYDTVQSITCDKTYAQCYQLLENEGAMGAVVRFHPTYTADDFDYGVYNGYTDYDGTPYALYGPVFIGNAIYDIKYRSNGSIELVSSEASGEEGTPVATKGTVSNHSIAVTPSVVNTGGYITGGTTIMGTSVTVSASELVSGTLSVSSNGTYNVTNYASASVSVPNTYTATVNGNGNYNHCYVSFNGTRYYDHGQKFTFSAGDTITLYADGINSSGPITINGSQVAYSSTSFATYDYVAIPSDITIILYYSSQAQISVSTTSVAVGSAFTPAVTITVNPAFSLNSSTGVITATATGSSSIMPTVTAGYIVSGTAGTVSVSGTSTYSLTTQAAQTITPTTSNQTISAGTYLTGAQTILGDANLLSSNIASGVSIFGVNGTFEGGGSAVTSSFAVGQLIGEKVYSASNGALLADMQFGYLNQIISNTNRLISPTMPRYFDFIKNHTYHIKGEFNRIAIGKKYLIDSDFDYMGSSIANIDWNEVGTQNTISMGLSMYAGSKIGTFFVVDNTSEDTKDVWGDFIITDTDPIDGFNNVEITFSRSPFYSLVNRSYVGVISYSSYFDSSFNTVVNRIGRYAFANCGSLSQVYFDNVKNINDYAFYYCTSLNSVHFENATNFGVGAFAYCSVLKNVYAPSVSDIGFSCFERCNTLESIYLPEITTVPQTAFAYCPKLANVSLPKINSIGLSAFEHCGSLLTINLSNVSVVGTNAFSYCSHMLTVTNTESLTSLGTAAFANCHALIGFSADNLSSTLGTNMFSSCSAMSYAYFSNVKSLGSYCFASCYNLNDVKIPNLSFIGSYAFANCITLSSVSFPELSGTSALAFLKCSGLLTISLPKLTTIGLATFSDCLSLSYACFDILESTASSIFMNCDALMEISIPNMKSITANTFAGVHNLPMIVLPKVSYIGTSAFASCYNLLSIYILSTSVCTMAQVNTFASTPISNYTTSTGGVYGSIYVPASLLDSYKNATNWKTYSARMVGLTDAEIAALL